MTTMLTLRECEVVYVCVRERKKEKEGERVREGACAMGASFQV